MKSVKRDEAVGVVVEDAETVGMMLGVIETLGQLKSGVTGPLIIY